jgi:hypothetical protein
MRARALLPFVAAGAVVALVAVALAATQRSVRINDPNDVRGKLDVREVRLRYYPGPATWTVITYRPWIPRDIWDRGNFFIFIDTLGDERPEYYAAIHSMRSRLVAELRRFNTDRVIMHLPVSRTARRSVGVSVPLFKLKFGPARTSYRWSAMTSFVGPRCHLTCFDFVPNRGRPSPEQWRPGMSPTAVAP